MVTSSLLLSAACLVTFPLLSTFPQFVTLGLLFGFFIAAYISLTSIVLVDLLGEMLCSLLSPTSQLYGVQVLRI